MGLPAPIVLRKLYVPLEAAIYVGGIALMLFVVAGLTFPVLVTVTCHRDGAGPPTCTLALEDVAQKKAIGPLPAAGDRWRSLRELLGDKARRIDGGPRFLADLDRFLADPAATDLAIRCGASGTALRSPWMPYLFLLPLLVLILPALRVTVTVTDGRLAACRRTLLSRRDESVDVARIREIRVPRHYVDARKPGLADVVLVTDDGRTI